MNPAMIQDRDPAGEPVTGGVACRPPEATEGGDGGETKATTYANHDANQEQHTNAKTPSKNEANGKYARAKLGKGAARR